MILILSDKVDEIAQMLDDETLAEMIDELAQVLCSVHLVIQERIELGLDDKNSKLNVPLPYKKYKSFELIAQWRDWAAICSANYKYLVELANACCEEYSYRFCDFCDKCRYTDNELETIECGKCLGRGVLPWTEVHKLQPVIEWCDNNHPALPRNLKQVGYALQDKDDISFEDAEYEEKMTPFPICVTDEYIVYKPGAYAGNGEYHAEPDLIASYRNYYKAALKKQIEQCYMCEGTNFIDIGNTMRCHNEKCNNGYVKYPVWSRRQKPSWL